VPLVGDKKAVLTLILMVALAISAVNIPTAYSAELSTSESSFFAEVLKLDMTEYNATKYIVPSKTGYFDDFGGLPKEEGDYVLKCNGSEIDVMYILVNNTFSYFSLYAEEGSPIFTEQPSTNLIERTDAFLEDYQNYLGNSEFQQYREILSTVHEVTDTSITVGNIRFEIEGTRFRWVNTFNGADYRRFSITFRNNGEFAFSDDRYNKIGSTDVDISKEEAIDIAMERVQNISWTVEGVEVGNVTILDNRTSVALLTAPKEPLMLYPYWQVSLTFDKVYPGSVYGVTYNIWADTGEIFYGHMHMLGGIIPEFPSYAILPLFLTATALIIFCRRRLLKTITK
jgi:hypothetical protein